VIVCLCHAASDRDIQSAIDDGARSIDDVGERCGAGTGCGACRESIGEMLVQIGLSAADRDAQDAGSPGCSRATCPVTSSRAMQPGVAG
jgi:bacterioferritin-associated ferredoxin